MFLLSSDTAAAGGIGIGFTLVYIVVIVVIMYFLAIRPQKKEQKKLNAMLAELAVSTGSAVSAWISSVTVSSGATAFFFFRLVRLGDAGGSCTASALSS